MHAKRNVPFEITRMDSLGQGVSKLTDKVTFIPKTAPGDEGEAEILNEKKGVAFGRIKKITKASPKRIAPACVHFNQCPSCHYQHVSYEDELAFKKEAFQGLFRKLPLPPIEVIGAPERFSYRNRIQLHYSLKSKLLGMRDSQTFAITPIPNCLIGSELVQKELQRLYQNEAWLNEAPVDKNEGHVEIYQHNNELKVSWNKPYADGGFTQVYELMNQKLKNLLQAAWKLSSEETILDLFAGNGNLSNGLSYSQRLCVDLYAETKPSDYFHQDLYDGAALQNVKKQLQKNRITVQHLLLDPPRSGLKDLSSWVRELSPKSIAYVSCDPHTLARDLMTLENYTPVKAFLIDFFPSTFHFESLIILERKLI